MLLAVVALWCWCTVVAAADRSLPPAAAPGEPAVATAAEAVRTSPPPIAVERSAVASPIVQEPPIESVRVHGRVMRSGAAVGGTELSFYAARDAWRERAADWAITDGNGRYEVDLPPDCYLVALQDTGQHASTVVVRSGIGEQIVDLVLPDVISAPSRASRGAAGRR